MHTDIDTHGQDAHGQDAHGHRYNREAGNPIARQRDGEVASAMKTCDEVATWPTTTLRRGLLQRSR